MESSERLMRVFEDQNLKVLLHDSASGSCEGCRVEIIDGDEIEGVGVLLHDIIGPDSGLKVGDLVEYKTLDAKKHPFIVAAFHTDHYRKGDSLKPINQFRIEIELGNAAMCESYHVAEALEQVRGHLYHNPGLKDAEERPIRDANGNEVGYWWWPGVATDENDG